MNKQSLLDPFFDKGANSSISAPRKRDAYASKRLRQVVSDFRKQKAQEGAGGSSVEDEQRRTCRSKRKTISGKRASKAPTKRKKAGVSHSKSSDEDMGVEEKAGPSARLAIQLRPRPKRRKVQTQSDGEEASEESE
jgi:DNA excision repair protein ERCC-5